MPCGGHTRSALVDPVDILARQPLDYAGKDPLEHFAKICPSLTRGCSGARRERANEGGVPGLAGDRQFRCTGDPARRAARHAGLELRSTGMDCLRSIEGSEIRIFHRSIFLLAV